MKTTIPGTSGSPSRTQLARANEAAAARQSPAQEEALPGPHTGPLAALASPPPQRQRSGREQIGIQHASGSATPPQGIAGEVRLQIEYEIAHAAPDPTRSAYLQLHRQDVGEQSFHSAFGSFSHLQTDESTASDHQNPECAATARRELAEHLRRYDAVADATDATESQAQLEQEYIGWAAERLQQRREAFGPNGGYRFNVDMKAAGTDASLPTAYRALKGFLASALRMPFGNAAATQLDKKDGELTPKFCPTVAGGAAAGLGSAFTEQILLSAIERRARLANMPAFRPVPPAILSPEPGPVRMEITPEGTKRFWRPPHADQLSQLGNHDDRPTFEVLQCDAQDRQRQLLQRQKLLEGHAEATFLRPLLSGGFSGIRRGLSPASVLLSPIKVLGTSMLSSGTGGALTNAILETGKALPWTGQARVDNLVGGSQTVNLFRLARPDESMEPLRWGDIRRLHNTLLDIVQEAGALAAQPLTSPRMAMRTARDLLLHHIGGNIFSSWVATGGGTLLASLVRGGYGAPPADEMLSSPGSVVQQSGQAFSDNTVWPALNSTLGDTSQNLAASLDRRRDSEQARLWSKAATMRNQLLAQIDTVRRNADGAQDQRLHELAGTLSQSLEHRGGAADLDAALGAIDRVLGEPGGATEATLERLRVLKDTVAQQRAVLVRSQALREWRSGRRQTSA